MLVYFLSGLTYGTIKTYLAAVRHIQISMDLPEPRAVPMPKLALVERGIRRVKATDGAARVRLPITPIILSQLKVLWSGEAQEFDIIMLWVACCTAFISFFKMGEITYLTVDGWTPGHCVMVEDMAVNSVHNPSIIKIHLWTPKTDQYGQGVTIYLRRTGSDLCPVSALLAYLAVRGGSPGPLFKLKDGRFLTKDLFVTRVRSALSSLGYDKSSYVGHSFRIGAATTAAEKGIEDSTIKMLGRWESSAYQLYVRASQHTLASISRRLVLSDHV